MISSTTVSNNLDSFLKGEGKNQLTFSAKQTLLGFNLKAAATAEIIVNQSSLSFSQKWQSKTRQNLSLSTHTYLKVGEQTDLQNFHQVQNQFLLWGIVLVSLRESGDLTIDRSWEELSSSHSVQLVTLPLCSNCHLHLCRPFCRSLAENYEKMKLRKNEA